VPKTPPDLTGVCLKLDRAEAHIETLRDEIATFRERDPKPFDFRTEDTLGPDQSVKYDLFAIVRKEPPRELSLRSEMRSKTFALRSNTLSTNSRLRECGESETRSSRSSTTSASSRSEARR
jgi:hypothetical protein